MSQRKSFGSSKMCYGESFPLFVTDAKVDTEPEKAESNSAKYERVIALLKQLLLKEKSEKSDPEQEQFDRFCAEVQKQRDAQNPHRSRKAKLSAETMDERNARSSYAKYVQACEESERAYAARNPHRR